MTSALSIDDLARVESVSRALLSPLDAPDLDAWRAEVTHAFGALFGVTRTLFAVPRATGLDFFSADMDAADLARFGAFLREVRPGALRASDRTLDRWFTERRRRGIGAYDETTMDVLTEGAYRRSPFYHEIVVERRMFDHLGLSYDLPLGEAFLCLSYDRPPAGPPRGDRLAILRALLPSFRAGLHVLTRLAAHRAALDAVPEPLAAFDPDGAEVHRNPALLALLATDPDGEQIALTLQLLARRLRPLAFPRRHETAPAISGEAEIRTARGCYRLRGTLLTTDIFGPDGSILILVTAPHASPLPSPDLLRERHGLTRREAEVALLVAEGCSNDEIAERLFVSRHTVRHHVEAAMAKLGVQGRGRVAVAVRLLQAA